MPDRHIPVVIATDEETEMVRTALRSFILPRIPDTEAKIAAFEKAVKYQVAHEKTIEAQDADSNIPDGTRSFSIGTFSMSFASSTGYQNSTLLTMQTICPYAYAVLREAGLLYRGVENGGDSSWL